MPHAVLCLQSIILLKSPPFYTNRISGYMPCFLVDEFTTSFVNRIAKCHEENSDKDSIMHLNACMHDENTHAVI